VTRCSRDPIAERRVAGKAEQVQDWRPVREPERGLERGLGHRPEQSRDSGLGQMQAQCLDLRQGRCLGRGHEQVPGWMQERRHEKGPGRCEEQTPERGLVLGLERGMEQRQGQCPDPKLLLCAERRHDLRLLRGEGLPQPCRGWQAKTDNSEFRIQSPEFRMAEV
jgi:hypothetical protein